MPVTTTRRQITGAGILIAYIATIAAANWAVAHLHPIHVWPGTYAPAGVLFAGLAFTLRNVAQDLVGRTPTLFALAAGTGLAYVIASPALAVASAAAFGFSELADFTVYTALRRRRAMLAYALAAAVGLVIDSALFIGIAFHGSWAYLPGQIIGKAEVTAVALLLVWAYRRTTARPAATGAASA